MNDMHYRMLYEISKELHAQHLDKNPTLQTLLSRTGEALDVQHGCLMTFTPDNDVEQLYILGADDFTADVRDSIGDILLNHGLVGYVYHSDRSVIIRNLQADARWTLPDNADLMLKQGSAVGVPIKVGNRVFAVMLLMHAQVDYFNDERAMMLDEIAEMASSAVSNMQQASEQQAHTYDTRYHAIFEHTPVPVVLTDSKGIIVDANYKACEFLGFRRVVLQGIPFQDVNIVPVDDIGDIESEEKHFRTDTYDIDGNAIPTLIRARQIQLDGETYIEWIMQDMSVQMELEQLRRDLSAMVYHDLRGPLGSIHMAILKLAELLQGHDNPAVLKIMQLGLRSTQQVSRLVESLLDIQRLEDGSTILDLQENEMHVLLTNALQLVLPNAEAHGVNVNLDITRLPVVPIDGDMILRVVINLMENAIKYTPSGGSATLRAEMGRDRKELRIIVSDTGPGIPEKMRNSIFDKFNRVNYQDAPKGVGLGLAFCRLAVDAHGGRIWVESDGENGSDFIFTLPLTGTESYITNYEAEGRDAKAEAEYATTA